MATGNVKWVIRTVTDWLILPQTFKNPHKPEQWEHVRTWKNDFVLRRTTTDRHFYRHLRPLSQQTSTCCGSKKKYYQWLCLIKKKKKRPLASHMAVDTFKVLACTTPRSRNWSTFIQPSLSFSYRIVSYQHKQAYLTQDITCYHWQSPCICILYQYVYYRFYLLGWGFKIYHHIFGSSNIYSALKPITLHVFH